MKVIDVVGRADLAQVFLLELRDDARSRVECVGAVDPSVPKRDKMVVVVSTQLGCAIGCPMCDAGKEFHGNLSAGEIFAQIDHVMDAWAGPEARACPKLKVQFARMGEPSLNPSVLDVLDALPARLEAPGLMPCVATTAPRAAARWMEKMQAIRDRHYGDGHFQLQISVQSTSEQQRDRMIPIPKWSLNEIAAFAKRFVRAQDRKVTLNFALTRDAELSPEVLVEVFDPRTVVVKITPLNPTDSAKGAGMESAFEPGGEHDVQALVDRVRSAGFGCILSVGLPEETEMRSSCGQLAYAPSHTPMALDKLEMSG